MTLEFSYTFKDYLEGFRAGSWVWRSLPILCWILFSIGALGIILNYWGNEQVDTQAIFSTYLPLLVIVGLWSLMPRFLAWSSWRGHRALQGGIKYGISEEGVRSITPTSDSFSQWETFIKFGETKNLFMLYVSRRIYYGIPKRAFESADQIREFRELARRKISVK